MSILGDFLKLLFPDGMKSVNDLVANSFEQNVKRRLEMCQNILHSNPAACYDDDLKREISDCRELLREYVETEKMYVDTQSELSYEEKQEIGEQVNELKQALNEMLNDITARVQEYRT
ncbi:MAG: hypothetical protein J6I42_09240 [Clostridia bacterium]|nr:hypothetical protein [Clostridia bacterium]